jgi:hypothetical protein
MSDIRQRGTCVICDLPHEGLGNSSDVRLITNPKCRKINLKYYFCRSCGAASGVLFSLRSFTPREHYSNDLISDQVPLCFIRNRFGRFSCRGNSDPGNPAHNPRHHYYSDPAGFSCGKGQCNGCDLHFAVPKWQRYHSHFGGSRTSHEWQYCGSESHLAGACSAHERQRHQPHLAGSRASHEWQYCGSESHLAGACSAHERQRYQSHLAGSRAPHEWVSYGQLSLCYTGPCLSIKSRAGECL